MKKLLILALILFCAAAGWSVGQRLSSDALSMAIGILFGILAGIPAALLVMAAGRRGERTPEPPKRMPQEYGGGFQAPVIVVSPPGAQYPQGYGQQSPQAQGFLPAMPVQADARGRREYRVVGVEEEWDDD